MEDRTLAWEHAREMGERAGVAIQPLADLSDTDRVREVIDRVWGNQVLPREMLRALQQAGCVLLGAEIDGHLVGVVFGFLGFEEGLHLHSHMLAVLPDRRGTGVGLALKLGQRAMCLEHGIGEVRWTYDPLVVRNARLNLVRLGAVAVRLLPDFYGEMTDRLNRGDRSDRFEVRWKLESTRVRKAVRGELEAPREVPHPMLTSTSVGEPKREEARARRGGRITVEVPPDHFHLRSKDPGLGMRWRLATRDAFQECFAAGLVATWITEDGLYVFEDPTGLPP